METDPFARVGVGLDDHPGVLADPRVRRLLAEHVRAPARAVRLRELLDVGTTT